MKKTTRINEAIRNNFIVTQRTPRFDSNPETIEYKKWCHANKVPFVGIVYRKYWADLRLLMPFDTYYLSSQGANLIFTLLFDEYLQSLKLKDHRGGWDITIAEDYIDFQGLSKDRAPGVAKKIYELAKLFSIPKEKFDLNIFLAEIRILKKIYPSPEYQDAVVDRIVNEERKKQGLAPISDETHEQYKKRLLKKWDKITPGKDFRALFAPIDIHVLIGTLGLDDYYAGLDSLIQGNQDRQDIENILLDNE